MTAGSPAGLAPVLKALGLSGMLDRIDARLAEGRAGALGHAEFLQVLCEDELARRDAAKITRRDPGRPLPRRRHLRGVRLRLQPQGARRGRIRDLARLEFIAAGGGHPRLRPRRGRQEPPAAALGHQACRRGHDVTFATCSQAAGPPGRRARRPQLRDPHPQTLARPALLVCDDFAMREFTAAQADDLYELVCRARRPARKVADPDLQPVTGGLVSAVPQRGRRRVRPGPSHHTQPPPAPRRQSYRPRRRPGRARPGPLLPRRAPETTAALSRKYGQAPSLPRPQRGASDSQCPAQPVTRKH